MGFKCAISLTMSYAARINWFACGVFTLLLSISTALANAGVLFVLIVKMRRVKNISEILLILLGVTDLLAGTFMHPFSAKVWFSWSANIESCTTFIYAYCSAYILTTVSTVTTLFITVDMYWKITKPFSLRWSDKTCLLSILSAWILITALVVLFVYVLPEKTWIIFETTMYIYGIMSYLYMCFAHYKINQEVKKMRRVQNSNISFSDLETIKKTAKMSQSVLIAFAACYSPHAVASVLSRTMPGKFVFMELYIRPWCDCISFGNSLMNPVIYCLRLKSVRKAVVETLFCKKRIDSATVTPGVRIPETNVVVTAT